MALGTGFPETQGGFWAGRGVSGHFWGFGQETAFAMLAEVTERALALTRAKHLLLVGGVACEWAWSHLGGGVARLGGGVAHLGGAWSYLGGAWSHLGGQGPFGTPILGGWEPRRKGVVTPGGAWQSWALGHALGHAHSHTCAQVTTGCRRCCRRCAGPGAPSCAPRTTGEGGAGLGGGAGRT